MEGKRERKKRKRRRKASDERDDEPGRVFSLFVFRAACPAYLSIYCCLKGSLRCSSERKEENGASAKETGCPSCVLEVFLLSCPITRDEVYIHQPRS